MTPVLALLTVPLPVDEGLWAGAGLETASFAGGALTCAPVDGDFFPVGVFGAAAPAVTADTCAPEAAWAVAAGALVAQPRL